MISAYTVRRQGFWNQWRPKLRESSAHLVGCIMRRAAVMQASRFECLSFDPFPLLQNGFIAAEVDVGGCDVVQALMVALVVLSDE